MKAGHKWLYRTLLLISAVLLAAALWYAYEKWKGYQEAGEIYDKVAEDATENGKDGFRVDWEKVPGAVAWIRMGKDISYPVMQGPDNQKYLHRAYNGKKNFSGSIFLHADCLSDFSGYNSIIYGHNMRNGTMFGSLKKYLKKPGKPYFYLYLPDGTKHTYEIFSAANVQDGTSAYTYEFATPEDFVKYQEKMLGASVWDTGCEPDENARLVSLSTCASVGSKKGRRVMIQGVERKVKKVQEPASWYSEPDDFLEE